MRTTVAILSLLAAPSSCLVVSQHARSMQPQRTRAAGATMDVEKRREELASGALNPATFWRLALNLHPPNKPDGESVELIVTLRFMQEQGFEPPQGLMLVESCLPEGTVELGEQKDRWTLSEDPDDQKDSLWIWGLFSQPLYPFLLLAVTLTEPVELPGGETIPAGKLFLQGEHRRDPDADTLLGAGTVVFKVSEEIKADLVGLSDFTYDEPIPCGSFKFLPGQK
uniref:Uncharacterized protein n=1 Tax=Phaeocystis antarctica TaxID=33657 RepID=A0A7S0I175_9EUKA|mmetsp:Transcript_529/g.1176  ORF Transcript_529/g.1176 Transcript_529/m.1176 type:complete len:225 (+) Transcript_529:14-688(+)